MSHHSISRVSSVLLVAGVCWVASSSTAAQNDRLRRECDETNGGIALPDGFCASVYADNLGHTRHLAVAASGAVYVNSWSSRYTEMKNAPGGFVVGLRDADGDGYAELIERFGTVHREGKSGGGTGIAVHRDGLYVEDHGKIVRYRLTGDVLVPNGAPETILSGLPDDGDHPMHPFAIAPDGALFVNSGSASNACQVENRALESPGRKPCPELATRSGIWRYDANETGQVFSAGERYATGNRNTVGLAIEPQQGSLYASMHGRDQLSDNWPKLYTDEQNNDLPAELFARIEEGSDFGWPYCYYDPRQRKHVLAPEYGGDGKSQGECSTKDEPDVTFPAHWAPEGVAFYSGSAFPERYRGGAFVSFHGSWNRKPRQAGFLVAFVPFADGRPDGRYEEFATGFAGAEPPADPKQARYRAMGIATGPDGALYVSDDVTGRIWRIVYAGGGPTSASQ
jgi:glucose/arabinose dehydrogenase